MRYCPSLEDDRHGVRTYELADGRRIRLDARAVREYGAATLLHGAGYMDDPMKLPRRPVYQDGRKVGTLPGSFDPSAIRSSTFLYDPRPGDFVEDGDGWRADRKLGPGDLEAVVGFQRP